VLNNPHNGWSDECQWSSPYQISTKSVELCMGYTKLSIYGLK